MRSSADLRLPRLCPWKAYQSSARDLEADCPHWDSASLCSSVCERGWGFRERGVGHRLADYRRDPCPLGLLSLVAWILLKLGLPVTAAAATAVVAAALLFAFGHIPTSRRP